MTTDRTAETKEDEMIAATGTRVSYEDMMNPRQVGTIVEIGVGWQGSEFRVAWDDGDETVSDLRQAGWRREGR